jgi:hypothetical protein
MINNFGFPDAAHRCWKHMRSKIWEVTYLKSECPLSRRLRKAVYKSYKNDLLLISQIRLLSAAWPPKHLLKMHISASKLYEHNYRNNTPRTVTRKCNNVPDEKCIFSHTFYYLSVVYLTTLSIFNTTVR